MFSKNTKNLQFHSGGFFSCDKVCSYGIVDGDKIDENIYRIAQLIEKLKRDQASSNLAILGRYILTDDIFDKIKETKPGLTVKSS